MCLIDKRKMYIHHSNFSCLLNKFAQHLKRSILCVEFLLKVLTTL